VSKLVIFRGDAVEHEIHLAGNTVRIGRDTRNEIVLDDKSVSRFHAEVRAVADAYYIVDLKSRNGVWVNGQQIKGKAPLALGVPVTLGAYELALEDDVSTGAFGEEPSLLSQHTVASAATGDQPDRPSRSATQRWSAQSPATAAKRSALFWSGLVLATLLLCGITYTAVRYMARPAPVEQAAVVPSPAPPEPQPPSQPPPVDPTREAIDRHLADARAAMESNDAAAALRDHLPPLLELDPGNQEALDLKRRAEEAIAAAQPPPRPRVPKPEVPAEVETPGISRRAGETWPDYTARAQRVQVNYQEGSRSLERQDFALAIARFQLVDRDQQGYRGVDTLITETAAKQQQAVEEAIGNGRKNEQAGKLSDAVRWYQQAVRFDANAAVARDRIAALTERLTKDGLEAFNRAEVFRKRNDIRAIEFYKQAADLLPSTHEKSREALEWLEKLKP
jgi:tetratricopeptide (TPR) repeat protein